METDELRHHLSESDVIRVGVIGDDHVVPGRLRISDAALELELDQPAPDDGGTVLIEFELGRWAWRLDASIREVHPGGLVLEWPRGALRRDRRRFERVARPGDGYALLLMEGDPRAVELLDVSPNGAAFRDGSSRRWAGGERVEVEVRLGDGAPAPARFEVRGVEPAGRGHVIRGRFLAPTDDSDPGDPLPVGLVDALSQLVVGLAATSRSR